MTTETLITLAWITLFVPAFGFAILVLWGKRMGRASAYVGTTILGLDLVLAAVIAYNKLVVFDSIKYIQAKFEWFNLGTKSIVIGIGVDNLAAVMLIVVTVISFLVHLFSTEYMRGDARFSRYYSYLGLFTFSMLGIVLGNNLLFMYIFWELVGVSSYLLIGFWYEKDSAANAGKKAFLTNRVGDFGFLIGLLIVYLTYNSFLFDDIFGGISAGVLPFDSGAWLTATGIFIFMGAIGKSAQFPLHVWLPDAMEGPTPVSALIHAATMVAAGVYLTARIFPMLTADALAFVAFIGAITAFMAATIAMTQNDFKKVLAYSTVSQLGYMVMSLGVASYMTGFFHLVTHAWFKGGLFLASGSVIHAMHLSMHHAGEHRMDPQDIRNMGGLRKTMPWTYGMFLIFTFAISGVPFASGFLSKDGILAGTLAFASLTGGIFWLIPILGFVAAALTAFYMFRLTILAFHGKPKTEIAAKTKENKFPIVFPLVVLAALSLWFVYTPNPMDSGAGWFPKVIKAPQTVVPAKYQYDFLLSSRHNEAAEESEGEEVASAELQREAETVFEETMHHMHTPAMILSLILAGLGIFIAFLIYQFKVANPDHLAKQLGKVYEFSLNKWYFDEFYQKTFIGGTVGLAKVMALFDNYVIDGLVNFAAFITRWTGAFIGYFDLYVIDGLVNLTANVTLAFGSILRKVQTGKVQAYVTMAIAAAIILIYYFM